MNTLEVLSGRRGILTTEERCVQAMGEFCTAFQQTTIDPNAVVAYKQIANCFWETSFICAAPTDIGSGASLWQSVHCSTSPNRDAIHRSRSLSRHARRPGEILTL
jgi:hypothetical protein